MDGELEALLFGVVVETRDVVGWLVPYCSPERFSSLNVMERSQ